MIEARTTILLIIIALVGCNDLKTLDPSDFDNLRTKKLLELSSKKELDLQERLTFIDSAYQYKKNKKIDTLTLKVLHTKSNIHYNLKQLDSSYFYDKLLLKKSIKIKNNYFKGKATHALAYFFKTQGVYDSAYFYYNTSKNSFQTLNDSSQVGRRLLSMGLLQKTRSDFFGSKETLTEALTYLNTIHDLKYLTSCYSALATNHRKLLNYEDAIAYSKKSIKNAQSLKEKLAYKNNLATIYIDHKDYKNALEILQEIISDSLLKKTNSTQYARILDNWAYAKWLSTHNEQTIALKEALKIRKKNNDKRGQIASYTHLGEFYSKTKPKRAASYFDSVIRLSKTIKMPRAEKDVLNFLMRLQPKNAILKERYIFLQDSLYAQELKVKTQFAKYKYDDKLKQDDILRLEKEKVEKELKVSQQRNQIIYISLGLGFLVLVSGFILYFFKQRTKRLKEEKKTETLKAIYETEAELSRRLHDDHGGKLNHTILLVQNNAAKSLVLDNLEILYNQSRDFSREINDIDTESNYKEELIRMLGSRKSPNTKLFITGLKQIDWLPVPTLTKTTLFKVLQELMINMAKHSEAKQVSIRFKKTSKTLQINYTDDGLGASQKNLAAKNGLRNTEKRIEAIDGTIIFDSEKGNGFKSEIIVPN